MPDPDIITPQNNFFLLGQEEAEKVVWEAYNNRKLHSSWLISGEEGIGKTTFAYKFARFLLDEKRGASSLNTSPDSPSNCLITKGSHPDLKIIERDYVEADRKKIIKSIKDGETIDEATRRNFRKSSIIKVDDVRTINEFLSKKSSQDGWRVVIIDSIDDMNAAASNALLKILEEPPAKSILLLISHNIGRLLPTIKSRCAKLMLKPLAENTVISLLRRYRPDLNEDKIKGIARISSGSIGKALRYVDGDALSMYENLEHIVFSGKNFKLDDMLDWVNKAVATEEQFILAKELILKFCSDNIISSQNVEDMALAWENAIRCFRQTDSLNMDKKQALINIVGQLCKLN